LIAQTISSRQALPAQLLLTPIEYPAATAGEAAANILATNANADAEAIANFVRLLPDVISFLSVVNVDLLESFTNYGF
jgi:hypothetical protein